MSSFSCVVMGNESLLIQCADRILQDGDRIGAVVTRQPDIRAWAQTHGLRVEAPGADLAERLAGLDFDWLFSIANLSVIPQGVLDQAKRGAINFHDGPLPRHAGLNAPVWAILARERHHGVTWHMIEGGIDEGDIVKQRLFDMAPNETALTLNTRCYEAAMESFSELLADLRGPGLQRMPQDLSQRSYHARLDRPAAAARIDLIRPADEVVALVGALDHGSYWNPLCCPKLLVGDRILLVSAAAAETGQAARGEVLEASMAGLVVGTGSTPVRLTGLRDLLGQAVCPSTVAKTGDRLPLLDPDAAQALTDAMARVAAGEAAWRRCLQAPEGIDLPLVASASGAARWQASALTVPAGLSGDQVSSAVAAWVARVSGKAQFDLAYRDASAPVATGYLSTWVPLRLMAGGDTAFSSFSAHCADALAAARRAPAFALDLIARDPSIQALTVPQVGLATDGGATGIEGSAITVQLAPQGTLTLWHDDTRVTADAAATLVQRLQRVLDALGSASTHDTPLGRLPVMSAQEREQVLYGWNSTRCDYERGTCVHQFFEQRAALQPEATAVVFEGVALSYAELDRRANQVAHRLHGMGVRPGTLVGLYTPRSLNLLIGALAIQKAGGAYVPLDPAYPADRVALYIEDSGAQVIVAQSGLLDSLPPHQAQVLVIDQDTQIAAQPDTVLDSGVQPADIAYMIYTSGSTGRPKGVMVEHRNVANFFRGMDDRIRHDPPGVWLAVTSLSFDISVLELFYTLARGFKLVLSSDENRALVSSGTMPVSAQKMDFSLYYWGNDDGAGPKKYELLLEGAKFADQHGFCAVWTPERHFHAFGGPYPNPSVTGAAVAAVTKNIGVRAGSCVGPLHHPARIAEEWAVIDNLTNGRAAVAIASGWQPDDFVLRPQNTPPNNKKAMFETIDQLRRLWRGEAVAFPTASGEPFSVVTQPRPVSKELPIWVTTAGNPETWKEAGATGANVLTHLLGQTVGEVGDKIKIYHQALRDAGHDPAKFTVTLMLHTYVAGDREQAREIARAPMKDYLRSAAGLIKQYAWAFPAFKKPVGVSNPFELDLRSLTEEEMEGILDFAFLRYFEDSGLFGTVDDCLRRVEELKAIGVAEVACLIDYGIPVDKVMEGLRPLAEVLRRTNEPTTVADDDFSIAAQILRHGVTHLQCTPSMARMIAMNDEARAALSRVQHLMIGGEALPGTLVAELGQVTKASIENMYGPTETTIWSSTETAGASESVVNIGRPIANTQMYVLDEHQEPVPVGVPGELYIGGDGVTRGYWQRTDLTAERFPADPFVRPEWAAPGGARMYRTGDLARWRADGRIDFLGRADFQVKIRGYRIELGEIEAVLEGQPGVRQAVVVAREDNPGDVRLVAYLRTDAGVSTDALRDAIAGQLPEHMLPAHFVTVDEFPLTPNRKVDRKALPAPSASPKRAATEAYVAPENEVEQKIAEIWVKVLGVPRVGSKDSFFALGGHSLLAVQAHREIRLALGNTKLSITDIFRFPTLEALARHLDNRPVDTVVDSAENAERAQMRVDAMSRRRAMRAGQGSGS